MTAKIVKGKEFERRHSGDDVAPVLKRSVDVLPSGGGVVSRDVLTAGEKAEHILAQAETEAARIRATAAKFLSEVEATREKARREGFTAGEAKGLATVSEKLIQLETLKERFYAGIEEEVVKLSLAIAEKVVGNLVTSHTEAIRSIVRQALEQSIGDRITVRVNPADYRTIMAGDSEFRSVVDRTKRLVFKEDEMIAAGGCIVETEIGTIDAQLSTQLAAMRKALEV